MDYSDKIFENRQPDTVVHIGVYVLISIMPQCVEHVKNMNEFRSVNDCTWQRLKKH